MIPKIGTCLIVPDMRPDISSGGIILVKSAHTELPSTGFVKYMSQKTNADFGIGHRVMFDQHKQQMLTIRGELLTQVKVEHVLAIL